MASRSVMHDHIMSRTHNALPTLLANQEEVIGVICNDRFIYDRTRHRILHSLGIFAVKETLIDAFVDQDNHQLDRRRFSFRLACCFSESRL